ncbi:hypothetical protein [Streptomyces chartreusis]
MNDIVDNSDMAQLLQCRLDEARTCYVNGAHVAAIMIGSLNETVGQPVLQSAAERVSDEQLVAMLVERARNGGPQLTGEDGLLRQL